MVVDNVLNFVKGFGDLKASDVAAMEAVIEQKENELEQLVVISRRDIETLKSLRDMLRKKFGMDKAKTTNRGKRGDTRQRVLDFLSNQDFPKNVATIAASLEMAKASIYHQVYALSKEGKIKRIGDGWELIRN